MKMSDILRDLAELLDQQDGQQGGQAADMSGNSTQSRMKSVSTDQHNDEDPQTDKMVPPLQQKHELMKKMAGVENEYDNGQGQPDELDRMKQMAGIQITSDSELE